MGQEAAAEKMDIVKDDKDFLRQKGVDITQQDVGASLDIQGTDLAFTENCTELGNELNSGNRLLRLSSREERRKKGSESSGPIWYQIWPKLMEIQELRGKGGFSLAGLGLDDDDLFGGDRSGRRVVMRSVRRRDWDCIDTGRIEFV